MQTPVSQITEELKAKKLRSLHLVTLLVVKKPEKWILGKVTVFLLLKVDKQ